MNLQFNLVMIYLYVEPKEQLKHHHQHLQGSSSEDLDYLWKSDLTKSQGAET